MTVAALVMSPVLSIGAGEKVEHRFAVAWSAEEIRRVELALPSSTIEVRSAPIDAVRVEATLRIERTGSDEWFEGVLEGSSLQAKRVGTRLVISESREGNARSFRARRLDKEWKFHVTLPEWTSVETDMTAGEVHVAGNLENVRIHLRAGEVHVEVPRDVVRKLIARARIGEVRTDTGSWRESREGILAGASSYENPNGRTEIEVKLTVGEIDIHLTD